MAQELLKKYLPQAVVFSRGLYADPSYTVPDKVKNFLALQGIAMPPHTATFLSREDMAAADYVFCMERTQRDGLLDRYAEFTDKIWLLNEFAFNQQTDTPDPIGLSGRSFDKNAAELARAVQTVAQRLIAQKKV